MLETILAAMVLSMVALTPALLSVDDGVVFGVGATPLRGDPFLLCGGGGDCTRAATDF